MGEMIENLKSSTLFKKMPTNQSERLKKVPPKTPRAGDVGGMVDCKIALLFKKANLSHYLPNIPTPLVLDGSGLYRKNFLEYEPEIEEEPELPEEPEEPEEVIEDHD